eukprot:6400245-Alexandrium_andersonii.AAC.1
MAAATRQSHRSAQRPGSSSCEALTMGTSSTVPILSTAAASAVRAIFAGRRIGEDGSATAGDGR